jgi:hypothetical protein
MTASIQSRLVALERPSGHACLCCELSVLSRRVEATVDKLFPRCTHWPRKTLAEELQELNTIEGTM